MYVSNRETPDTTPTTVADNPTTGYYDNRYWSIDKLLTFGANNTRDAVNATNAYDTLSYLPEPMEIWKNRLNT